MTKELEKYLVRRIEKLEQVDYMNRSTITSLRVSEDAAHEFENKVLKLAKLIEIVPAHKVEDKATGKTYDVDEYVKMDSFYRDKDPELYDFVIETLKWDRNLEDDA